MKSKLILSFLLAGTLLTFNACHDKCYKVVTHTVYDPIYTSESEALNSFAVQEPRKISAPAKIYTYNNLLLVGEKNQGIHIIDNTNPASPVHLKFVKLAGNFDFVVKDNIVLADNGADLVSISIADLGNIKLVNRLSDRFKERVVAGKGIIVGYNEKEVTEKVECSRSERGMFMSASKSASTASSFGGSNQATGRGGSSARFAIANNYLYIVTNASLLPFNITSASTPISYPSVNLGMGTIETIFPFKDHLFIGSTGGVYIYDYVSNPTSPKYVSMIQHMEACDPVVCQGNFAFSTLRSGRRCATELVSSGMQITDISNIASPQNITWTNMEDPYGLGIDGSLLLVCQGNKGLYVYDWDESRKDITLVTHYDNIYAYDVIINNKTLIVTASNGVFQFDCTNPKSLKFLSSVYEP